MKKEIVWGTIPIKGLEDGDYNKYSLKDLQQNDIKLYGSRHSKNIAKKVYRYDLDGNFIKEYENGMVAAQDLNINNANIYQCIYGIMHQCHKSIWTDKFYEQLPKNILERANNSKWVKYDRPIYQYDKYGNLINEFNNLKEISNKRGKLSNIKRWNQNK